MFTVEVSVILAVLHICGVQGDATVVADTGPLRVQYGRSVSLDPRVNLVIKYPKAAHCRVTVLRDNPLSQRNGFLVPDIFPCNFKLGDVRYTHLGSKFHTRDFVKFQIRVDTEMTTEITPLVLPVSVLFTPMEIVRKSSPIVVSEVGGVSSNINRNMLSFAYDSDSEECHVVLLHFNNPMPRYGDLLNVTNHGPMGARYQCNDFINSDIRYVHTKLQSSNRDYIPLMAEISDTQYTVLKREYFQIIVRILGARVNERPAVSFQASNTLEIKQYALGAITSSVLAAIDLETNEDEIIFNVSQPLGPGEGHLISLDDPYRPLTAFFQKDVKDFKIAYRPPTTRSPRSRMFQMVLTAVDIEDANSDPILLLIMVKPTNANAPLIIKNSGLSLFEGQSRAFSSARNLKVTDRDNFGDVRIQVVGGLRHGELRILGNQITTFMATDLEYAIVTYRHDNSETYSDNIIFRVSDGANTVDFVFPITIAPLDDQAPKLVYNTGLVLDEGETVRIDQYMLSAMDVDSDDTKIKFKIVNDLPSATLTPDEISTPAPSGPTVGVLCLRQRVRPIDMSGGWRLQFDGHYEKNATLFTQRDLMEGRLFYRHLGGEFIRDQINFVLFDNAERPNVSPIQRFNIVINKVDDQVPRLFSGCPLGMTVDELGQEALGKSVLRYTDIDSEDNALVYTITMTPYFVDGRNSTRRSGGLFLVGSDVTVTRFTQLQVNHKKVVFKAPNMEIGFIPRHVQFKFSVSDTSGNVLPDQVFQILVRPVNNKAPSVMVNQVEVPELEKVIINDTVLSVQDDDTPVNQLQLSITVLPRYGFLYLDGLELGSRDWFTMNDVTGSRLSYRHTKLGEASDEVRLQVEDGVHKKNVLVEILIIPKPRNLSRLILNVTLRVKEHSQETIKLPLNQANTISPRDLNASLRVNSPPRVGRILRDGVSSEEFSAQDIKSGLVSYEHIGEETGLLGDEDHFNLTFVDQSEWVFREGRKYEAIEVMTLIIPVDSQPPVVRILRPLILREGATSRLSQQHITVTDPDTRESDVTCTIDVQPTFGFLENVLSSPGSEISNAGKRITSFTIRDIKHGNINYIQSEHEGVEPRLDWVAFSCTDSNNTSPRYLFNIVILPRNDEVPQLYSREFVVQEGAELIIDVTLLNAVDADAPLDELIFYVIDAPQHGIITDTRLEGNVPVSRFTLTQIRKSTSIVYHHDSSETTKDSLRLAVSDGVHNTTQTIPIRIIPVDDEQPRLTVNVGLRLEAIGESEVLTPRNIQATDIDSPDENITFVLRTPPRAGLLQIMRENGIIINLVQWQKFEQKDVARRLVIYTHNPKIPTERDEIHFDVTDGKNPLLNQIFYIFINVGDRIPPTVLSKGVQLRQGTCVTITTDFLSASDLHSNNANLRYSLTKVPTQGHLELVGAPEIAIRTFRQLDIAANKVVYVHTGKDETAGDSFDFEVSDGSSSTVTRKFLITLLDVNNKKPVVISTRLVVREGSSVTITPFELRVEDRDTQPEALHLTTTRVPLHGMLLKRGHPVRTFSQEDINNNLVSYLHDGTDTTADSFYLSISDGTHSEFFHFPDTQTPQRKALKMNIHIRAVDNRPPQLIYNKGVTDLQVFANGRLGYKISKDLIQAEDPDSNNTALVYQIHSPPLNGYLTKSLSRNTSAHNFTQGDLDVGGVYYVLFSGSNATSDIFEFSILDPAGNSLPHQSFSLVWAWVSFNHDSYQVDETDGFLTVTIHREGFLGGSSFVRVSVNGLTADLHDDFSTLGITHAQFSPGQTHAVWRIRIIDDNKSEGNETFELRLENLRGCVKGKIRSTVVTIIDTEDVPTVEMINSQHVVEEGVGRVGIQLRRIGDPSTRIQFMCITRYKMDQGSASGTMHTSILSYSDYITRSEGPNSVITLKKGEMRGACTVEIIDDSLYEDEEKFTVELKSYLGSHVTSKYSTTDVLIVPDSADEPKISFALGQYVVDESDGAVQVTVRRTGTDLSRSSSAFIRSRQTEPITAEASKDYIPIARLVYFSPHVTSQIVHVTILDDTGLPRVEREEQFELVLRTPINAGLGQRRRTVVTINDSFSDLPVVQFKNQRLSIKENIGVVRVPVTRTGDLTYTSTVTCYTRQATARVERDYRERTNTGDFLVTFAPTEHLKYCEVAIIDDLVYEDKEKFRIVLGSLGPFTHLGNRKETVITIEDPEDKPLIQLSERRMYVGEPVQEGQSTRVTITVLRTGDLTKASRVRIYTVDGTAKSGQDYQPVTKVFSFSGNLTRQDMSINILFNTVRKIRRAFYVYLTSDMRDASDLGRRKVVIYIEKSLTSSDVTFPLPPKVVSLRHYDDVTRATEGILPGYPVICVTACNPKFARYTETGSMCTSQNIDDRLTQYRWMISTSTENTFTDLTTDTFFTQTDSITLDSVYLLPGSRIRCAARATTTKGELGLESSSLSVTVQKAEGVCPPRDPNHVGSEPFTASIAFTGARSDGKANLVHIKIQIPHTDGLIPVISTSMLDIREALNPGVMRVAQHKCSNLLDIGEIPTTFGFLGNGIKDSGIMRGAEPYQYSTEIRGNTTVRFYRNLNLESCVWSFESFFYISELIQYCGGSLAANEYGQDLTQSQLALRVPLFVSYVYLSRTSQMDWVHYDHATFLRLTLVYDTAVLLNDGVQASEGSLLSGSLWPTSIKIRASDKMLVVNFKTKTKFRGIFLLRKVGVDSVAMVMSRDHPHLSFTLKLLSSQQTYDNPEQRWQFVSGYAVKDYTGTYYIKLVPCTVHVDTPYSEPLQCNAQNAVTFNLPIRFQQIPDPVPARFTLSVEFHLMTEKSLWLAGNPLNLTDQRMDKAFSRESKIYGLISLDQGRRVGGAGTGYLVSMEKIYLCSGEGDYVPSYDPASNKFGCLADSLDLLNRLKVLDRQAPDSVTQRLANVPFDAKFASEDPAASGLAKRADADGFTLNTAPLFQVPRGRKWYMHAVYSVSSDPRKKQRKTREIEDGRDVNLAITLRHIVKESLHTHDVTRVGARDDHVFGDARVRRDAKGGRNIRGIGNGEGTNMKMIRLNYETADDTDEIPGQRGREEDSPTADAYAQSLVNPLVIGIAVVCAVLLIALVVVWTLYKRKGRRQEKPVNTEGNTISVLSSEGTAV